MGYRQAGREDGDAAREARARPDAFDGENRCPAVPSSSFSTDYSGKSEGKGWDKTRDDGGTLDGPASRRPIDTETLVQWAVGCSGPGGGSNLCQPSIPQPLGSHSQIFFLSAKHLIFRQGNQSIKSSQGSSRTPNTGIYFSPGADPNKAPGLATSIGDARWAGLNRRPLGRDATWMTAPCRIT